MPVVVMVVITLPVIAMWVWVWVHHPPSLQVGDTSVQGRVQRQNL